MPCPDDPPLFRQVRDEGLYTVGDHALFEPREPATTMLPTVGYSDAVDWDGENPVDPAGFACFDDVDSRTITDPGAPA